MARIRVALAQVAGLPAYATATANFLREPAPPRFEAGRFPGYLSLVKNKPGINQLMTRIAEVHRNDLEEKLRRIGAKASEHKVHLLALPEYIVPLGSIPMLRELSAATGMVIAAGTHVVSKAPDALAKYRANGMMDVARTPASFVRKAVCPVLYPDGTVSMQFKTIASKWEEDLVLHQGAQPPIELDADGGKVRIQLAICIEALKSGFVAGGGQALLVLSMSPPHEQFESVLRQSAFNEMPGIFVNDALHGGSTVVSCPSAVPPALNDLFTAPAGDEVLTIADLELDEQFGKVGSIKATRPAQLIARAPLIYECVADQAEVAEFIRQIRDRKFQPQEADLRAQLRRTALPAALRAQMQIAADALEFATENESLILLDAIVIPVDCLPFANRCAQALEESSRAISEALTREPGDEALVTALGSVSDSLREARKRVLPITYVPTPIDESRMDSRMTFVNREEDRRQLGDVLRRENVLLVEGLEGIGKRRLVWEVASEVAPRSPLHEMFCVPGQSEDSFLEEFEGFIGYELSDVAAMSGPTRAQLSAVVLVHRAEELLGSRSASAKVRTAFAALGGTNVRVMLTAIRRPPGFVGFALPLRRLKDSDLERILAHWCAAYGIDSPSEIVSHLHGHPLAAKFAAQALREGRTRALDRLQFVKRVQKGIVEVLLSDLALSPEEEKALRALSIFRRPVSDKVLADLPVSNIDDLVDRLEDRFLVERFDGKVFVVPIVREYAEDEWLKRGNYQEFHEVGAKYYKQTYETSSGGVKFEAREEAIYHFSAAGNLGEARALGVNWRSEAEAAIEDYFRRRDWESCADLCEKVLSASGFSLEVASRAAVAYARRARWRLASDLRDKVQKAGEMPQWLEISYAEAYINGGLGIEGIKMLEEIAERDPAAAYPRAVLAEALIGRNQSETAEKYIEEALDLDPRSFRTLSVASRMELSRGQTAKALEFATRAMEIDPVRGEKNYEKIKAVFERAGGQKANH